VTKFGDNEMSKESHPLASFQSQK